MWRNACSDDLNGRRVALLTTPADTVASSSGRITLALLRCSPVAGTTPFVPEPDPSMGRNSGHFAKLGLEYTLCGATHMVYRGKA